MRKLFLSFLIIAIVLFLCLIVFFPSFFSKYYMDENGNGMVFKNEFEEYSSNPTLETKIYVDEFGNEIVVYTNSNPPSSTSSDPADPGTASSSKSKPFYIILLRSVYIIAFFVGGHIYKKYGAMLSVWKRHYLPLSLLVEPYIYSYRFQETTKPILRKYRTKIVISFVVCFLLFSPIVGVCFSLGYALWFILWRSKLDISQEICIGAANLFDDFVMPGLEDELSETIVSFYIQKTTGIKFKY